MEITIHTVAQKAKVSVSTASRILNGGTKGLRRDATARAEQVLAAARSLGYEPNHAARSLVLKRSWTLGLITTEIDNPVRSRLIESLRQKVLDMGFQLLVAGIKHGKETIVKKMLGQRLDGLILGNIEYDLVSQLNFSDLPIVGFGQGTGLPCDHIRINYGSMIEKLTAHLIEKHGLRKIAFAGFNHYPRKTSYERIMDLYGYSAGKEFWETEGWTMEAGRHLARRQMKGGSRPEGIVCHNDLLAVGIIAGLRDCGIRVPDDIAVVGMDNIEMADYCNPTLTTAGIQNDKLVNDLFFLLHDRIEKKDIPSAPREITCPEETFFRESCGCRYKA